MVSDTKARDRFIESNLGLVHSLCRRFSGRGIEYDDLFQAGCMGLIKAADAFEEERGLCFSTYAVPVILGEVRRLFRDGGSVKVSRSIRELSLKIGRERERLELKLGREPSICEIAKALDVPPEDITEALCATQPTVSLTYEDEDGNRELDLPEQDTTDLVTERIYITEALNRLDETERQLMIYRYFNFYTQSKTAQLLNMSQVQVSRTEKRVLKKLRGIME